jgi:hypothetical protein
MVQFRNAAVVRETFDEPAPEIRCIPRCRQRVFRKLEVVHHLIVVSGQLSVSVASGTVGRLLLLLANRRVIPTDTDNWQLAPDRAMPSRSTRTLFR